LYLIIFVFILINDFVVLVFKFIAKSNKRGYAVSDGLIFDCFAWWQRAKSNSCGQPSKMLIWIKTIATFSYSLVNCPTENPGILQLGKRLDEVIVNEILF